jgi:hypothetical protein
MNLFALRRKSGFGPKKKKPTVETAGANDCLLYE